MVISKTKNRYKSAVASQTKNSTTRKAARSKTAAKKTKIWSPNGRPAGTQTRGRSLKALPWAYRLKIADINSTFVKISSWREGAGYEAAAELYDKGTQLAKTRSPEREAAENAVLKIAEGRLSSS